MSIIESVAFSPADARILATASYDGSICIWKLSETGRTSTLCHRLSSSSDPVRCIAWSTDGLFLVSSSGGVTIRRWNTSSGECELEIRTPDRVDRVNAVSLSPDNKHVLSGGETIYVWDSSTGQIIVGPLRVYSTVYSVAYSPNGQYFVSGSLDGSVIVWDSTAGTNHLVPFKSHSCKIHSIAFHPTSETFASSSEDGVIVVWVWNANTFESIYEIPIMCTCGFYCRMGPVQYSPDGRLILSTRCEINVLCTQTGKVFEKTDYYVFAAAFSPDGRWVASGSGRGTVKIWDFLRWDT